MFSQSMRRYIHSGRQLKICVGVVIKLSYNIKHFIETNRYRISQTFVRDTLLVFCRDTHTI